MGMPIENEEFRKWLSNSIEDDSLKALFSDTDGNSFYLRDFQSVVKAKGEIDLFDKPTNFEAGEFVVLPNPTLEEKVILANSFYNDTLTPLKCLLEQRKRLEANSKEDAIKDSYTKIDALSRNLKKYRDAKIVINNNYDDLMIETINEIDKKELPTKEEAVRLSKEDKSQDLEATLSFERILISYLNGSVYNRAANNFYGKYAEKEVFIDDLHEKKSDNSVLKQEAVIDINEDMATEKLSNDEIIIPVIEEESDIAVTKNVESVNEQAPINYDYDKMVAEIVGSNEDMTSSNGYSVVEPTPVDIDVNSLLNPDAVSTMDPADIIPKEEVKAPTQIIAPPASLIDMLSPPSISINEGGKTM